MQPLETYTGLKTAHATKLYKNYYKGDHAFKPQKGNFGKVSWFAGSGNPYVGGQAQNYTVTVDVSVPKPTRLPDTFFDKFKDAYLEENPEVDLTDNRTHRAFWAALGKKLEGQGLAEVYVPQGELSVSGKGTFVSVDSRARMAVTLSNPNKLRSDLLAQGVDVDALEKAINDKEQTHAKSFTVTFASVREDVIEMPKPGSKTGEKVLKNPTNFLKELYGKLNWKSLVLPQKTTPVSLVKTPVPPNASIVEKLRGARYQVTLMLEYPSYKVARQQAKLLATVASTSAIITNDYGGLTLTKGTNWSDKAIRAYTEVY